MMGVAYLMHGSDKYRFHVLLVTTSLPLSGKLVSSTPQPHRHTHTHTHTLRGASQDCPRFRPPLLLPFSAT